jgi:hypothetical protein
LRIEQRTRSLHGRGGVRVVAEGIASFTFARDLVLDRLDAI